MRRRRGVSVPGDEDVTLFRSLNEAEAGLLTEGESGMNPVRLPGFTAEAALGPATAWRAGRSSFIRPAAAVRGVTPQFASRAMSGVDLGAYWRCRPNGVGDLVSPFFSRLPPFTTRSLLFSTQHFTK